MTSYSIEFFDSQAEALEYAGCFMKRYTGEKSFFDISVSELRQVMKSGERIIIMESEFDWASEQIKLVNDYIRLLMSAFQTCSRKLLLTITGNVVILIELEDMLKHIETLIDDAVRKDVFAFGIYIDEKLDNNRAKVRVVISGS